MSTQVAMMDDQTEQALLGAVMLDPDMFKLVRHDVKPKDFFLLRHQYIWAAMNAVVDDGQEIERHSLRTALSAMGKLSDVGGDIYISELINSTSSAVFAEQHAKIIRRYSVRRQIKQAADQLNKSADDAERSTEELLADGQDALNGLTMQLDLRDVYTLRDGVATWLSDVEAERETTWIHTGLRHFDERFGGLPRGEYSIVAGATGMGKSVLLPNIGLNAATAGFRVLYVSVEMTMAQLTERWLAMHSGIPLNVIHSMKPRSPQLTALAKTLPALPQDNIVVTDAANMTPSKIRALAIKYGPFDLIAVDYVQIMNADRQYRERRLEIAEIARDLKAIAKEIDAAMLVAAQFNREANIGMKDGGKRPRMEQLGESAALEHNAAQVIIMHQDEAMRACNPPLLELHVDKNRHGQRSDHFNAEDPVLVYFDMPMMRMRDTTTARRTQNIHL